MGRGRPQKRFKIRAMAFKIRAMAFKIRATPIDPVPFRWQVWCVRCLRRREADSWCAVRARPLRGRCA